MQEIPATVRNTTFSVPLFIQSLFSRVPRSGAQSTYIFGSQKVLAIRHDHVLHTGLQHDGAQRALLPRAVPAPIPVVVREEDVHPVLRVCLVLLLRLEHETLDHVVVPRYDTDLELVRWAVFAIAP